MEFAFDRLGLMTPISDPTVKEKELSQCYLGCYSSAWAASPAQSPAIWSADSFRRPREVSISRTAPLAVNTLGCLVIGFTSQLLESRGFFSESARFFVFVGLLGGFTTFSTFSNESMNLLQRNQMLLGAVNVVLQVSLGLFAVWIGRTFAYLLWR